MKFFEAAAKIGMTYVKFGLATTAIGGALGSALAAKATPVHIEEAKRMSAGKSPEEVDKAVCQSIKRTWKYYALNGARIGSAPLTMFPARAYHWARDGLASILDDTPSSPNP